MVVRDQIVVKRVKMAVKDVGSVVRNVIVSVRDVRVVVVMRDISTCLVKGVIL